MMERRPPTRVGSLLALVAGLAVGSLWWVVDVAAELPFQMQVIDLLLFAVAAAVTELLPIRHPGGRSVPTSLAVVGAAAILGAAPPVVALVAAGGWALARLLERASLPPAHLLLRALGGWTLAGLAAAGVAFGPPTIVGDAPAGTVAATLNLGAAVAVSLGIMVFLPAVETLTRLRTPWRFALRRVGEAIVATALVGTSIASTAALGALVHPVLGHWTLPTMLIPLLAARIGLDRFAVASRAYDQTIRAMSRLPEQLGTVPADHGIRVAELSREVAMELGLDAGLVSDVVRAAHLHEVGRIKLERDAQPAQRELALAGAGVIQESAQLDRVAHIVAAHGEPTRALAADGEVTQAARIVAACCEVDRYAPDPTSTGQRHEVVVRLVREVGDLDVVGALTRVLDRRDRAL